MASELNLKLREGDPAPGFSAPTNGGGHASLKDFRGKHVVLFFYPKDDTPGCTKEACGFRDTLSALTEAGAVVLGVSVDSAKKHDRFVEKFQLPFPLISDEERRIVQAYGVWGKKKFMGREYLGTHRVTFLIDPQGTIQKIWRTVKPEEHAGEVLAALQG